MVAIQLTGENRFRKDCHKTFTAAVSLVQGTLERCGCDGSYSLVPRSKIHWKSKEKNKVAMRPAQGREIRLKVRPGDNDSAWEYSLLAGGNVVIDAVRESLEHLLGPEDHEPVVHVVHDAASILCEVAKPVPSIAKEPVPAASPMEMLSKLSEAMQREQKRLSEREDINNQVDLLTKQIEELSKTREKRVQRLLDIELEQSKDTDAKAASELLGLLAKMQGQK